MLVRPLLPSLSTALLQSKLSSTHEVVQISSAQMDALCGNVLELQGGKGLPVMAMSSQAHHAFTPEQRAVAWRSWCMHPSTRWKLLGVAACAAQWLNCFSCSSAG
jgi:hypothetical protein